MSSRTSDIFSTSNSVSYLFDDQGRLEQWTVNSMDVFDVTYDNFGNKKINSVITASATDELSYMSDAKFNLDDHTSSVGFAETTDYNYTNQNRIADLTEKNTGIADAGLDFTYGADNQRRTMSILQGTQTTFKKRYFMNYEEHEENGQVTKKVYYLDGAVLVKENDTDKLYFTLNDYDGSIQALMNSDGTLAEQYAYDPWGKRVNPIDWVTNDTRTSFIQDRGFTGHEHIDRFGVINMNARLYDPFIGTFLQPDPYMQDITNPINFNRYSYCLNNPLRYTDPSGEKWYDWLNPVHYMSLGMQWINDNTVGLRQDMMNAGVPDFNVGYNTSHGEFHQIGNTQRVYGNSGSAIQKSIDKFGENLSVTRNAYFMSKKNPFPNSRSNYWPKQFKRPKSVPGSAFSYSVTVAGASPITYGRNEKNGKAISIGYFNGSEDSGFFITFMRGNGGMLSGSVDRTIYYPTERYGNYVVKYNHVLKRGEAFDGGVGPVGVTYSGSHNLYGTPFDAVTVSGAVGAPLGAVHWQTYTIPFKFHSFTNNIGLDVYFNYILYKSIFETIYDNGYMD